MLEFTKQEVRSIQYSGLKEVAVSVKNEAMEMIAKVAKRKGRLDLPIVSGKYPAEQPYSQPKMRRNSLFQER